MDFFEAIIAIKEGKKVRLTTWPMGEFIGLEIEEKIRFGKKVIVYKLISEDCHATQLQLNMLINQSFETIE